MSYSHHPLPEVYLEILNNNKSFDLTIVGKDPYPSSPTGIPFCKNSWCELFKDNCSGSHVLKSIGINLSHAKLKHVNPMDLFLYLAREGIAFLNASYHFLDSDLSLKRNRVYIKNAMAVNKPIIVKTKTVILCGQAKYIKSTNTNESNFIEVIHPDVQNRKFRKKEWEKVWLPNVLMETFDLNLEI